MSQHVAQELTPVDAAVQDEVTDEQAQFFRDNGLLLIRNALSAEELRALQDATYPLYRRAVDERPKDPDYAYARHELTGEMTPFRIEYMIDKDPSRSCLRLLGHPFILRSISRLQGPDFIPTWDSMVFKTEGMGKAIPWHRDAAPYNSPEVDNTVAAINVDFYLDGSDLTNCLWGIPGSNLWSATDAQQAVDKLNVPPAMFSSDERCVPLPVQPGDVLFHNVLVLHGSPAARSTLRRVIYYEFRPAEVEAAHGPHTREYIPLKQSVLAYCIQERAKTSYAASERPFVYSPTHHFPFDPVTPSMLRYPHSAFWRKD